MSLVLTWNSKASAGQKSAGKRIEGPWINIGYPMARYFNISGHVKATERVMG